MNNIKYIGMDVHKATTVIAVLNHLGKVISEAIVETKGASILDFLKSVRGTLHVTFEEGTQAAWLYDLIRPHVALVVVCNPKKIAVQDNKADKRDARRLAELLRTGSLEPVYHGEHSNKPLKEFAQSYGAIVSDSTRVKSSLSSVETPPKPNSLCRRAKKSQIRTLFAPDAPNNMLAGPTARWNPAYIA